MRPSWWHCTVGSFLDSGETSKLVFQEPLGLGSFLLPTVFPGQSGFRWHKCKICRSVRQCKIVFWSTKERTGPRSTSAVVHWFPILTMTKALKLVLLFFRTGPSVALAWSSWRFLVLDIRTSSSIRTLYMLPAHRALACLSCFLSWVPRYLCLYFFDFLDPLDKFFRGRGLFLCDPIRCVASPSLWEGEKLCRVGPDVLFGPLVLIKDLLIQMSEFPGDKYKLLKPCSSSSHVVMVEAQFLFPGPLANQGLGVGDRWKNKC